MRWRGKDIKRNGKFTLALFLTVAAVLGAIDVAVFIWKPTGRDFKSPLAVPVLTFFLVVVLYAALTELMRRRVVVEMRGNDNPAVAPRDESPGTPAFNAPPLRVEVSTTDQILASSMHTSPAATRARHIFDRSIALHRNQFWLLLIANGVIATLGLALQQPFPLSGVPGLMLIGAPLALAFLGALGSRVGRTTIYYVAWLALHTAWVVATCFVCVSYLARAAFAPPGSHWSLLALATMAALTLVVYGLRLRVAHRRLRGEFMASPPIRLLFLWVFGDGMRINSLLSGIGAVWRCVGPLQFLQGGGMIGMGADTFRHFTGRALPAATDQEVDARIARFVWSPAPRACMYSTNTLLCGDRSWRQALNRLLETDLVLMDLSGFSSANAGCVYEIGRIVDRVDVSRAVFLVDSSTDMTALRTTLEAAWNLMSPASPNCRPGGSAIRLFHCDPETDAKGRPRLGGITRNAESLLDLLCVNAAH